MIKCYCPKCVIEFIVSGRNVATCPCCDNAVMTNKHEDE